MRRVGKVLQWLSLGLGTVVFTTVLVLFAYPSREVVVEAATLYAASCNQGDVQVAIDAAEIGDIVQVPDGDCAWSSTILIHKAITLKGNGRYVIDDDHHDVGTWPLTITLSGNTGIEIDGDVGDFIRVTGFQFLGTAPGGTGGHGAAIYSPASNGADWRLDNSRFQLAGNSVKSEGNFGLIDHIYTYDAGCTTASWIVVSDLRADWMGNGAFTEPVGFGGPNFLFIEDSTFWKHCTDAATSPFVTDAQAGGKYVFRHNYVRDAATGWHGTESGAPERGGYAFEIYENEYFWPITNDKYHTAIFHRGGTALVHNNTATNYQALWKSWVHRATRAWGRFGQCDGTQAHDGNAGIPNAPGYPCLDQVGRGMASGTELDQVQPQGTSIVHIWNNTLINSGAVSHNNPSYVVEGRDYEISADDSAKPDWYTPYPYPHPLTQAGSSLQGDVNNDGEVDSQDILACADHILGRQDWGWATDVNQDGVVNVLDVQRVVGLMNSD